VVNPVVKVDPWLVDQRVNYGLKNRPLVYQSTRNEKKYKRKKKLKIK